MQNVKLKTVTGILIFFISLFVYLITLCPTVYVGDCGELTTSVYQLGIAHPPGYPIYCILGKIFCAIPFSNIAYRVNFMSAFFCSSKYSFIISFTFKNTRISKYHFRLFYCRLCFTYVYIFQHFLVPICFCRSLTL